MPTANFRSFVVARIPLIHGYLFRTETFFHTAFGRGRRSLGGYCQCLDCVLGSVFWHAKKCHPRSGMHLIAIVSVGIFLQRHVLALISPLVMVARAPGCHNSQFQV